MIYSSSSVILDACVLYPAPLRDFLLRLAAIGLFRPTWTEQINEEWMRNLLANRQDLFRKQLEYTKQQMNKAFPDANVDNYKDLIETVNLPDPDDRHVVAAAIKSSATAIITYNLKDFPAGKLKEFDIQPLSPDQFIADLFDLDRKACCEAFYNLVKSLSNPPQSSEQVLETLANQNLSQSADLIKMYCLYSALGFGE